MGMEYRLEFRCEEEGELWTALGRLAGASPDDGGRSIEFRRGSNGAMPDASMHREQRGAYFCDHGGAGREVLGLVLAVILSFAPDVRVASLDA